MTIRSYIMPYVYEYADAYQSNVREGIAKTHAALIEALDAADAEVDRLNTHIWDGNDTKVAMAIHHTTEVNKLKAENAKLREALEQIETATACTYSRNIARAVLEGTK